MKDFKKLENLKRIVKLARLKATGTPAELAQKLNLSERTVQRYIGSLRLEGFHIEYCRKEETYLTSQTETDLLEKLK